MRGRVVRLVAVATVLVLVSGCSGDSDDDGEGGSPRANPAATATTASPTPGDPVPATEEIGDRSRFYLKTTDQKSDGRSIVVDEVVLAGAPGWLVIHSNARDYPGQVLGVSGKLTQGTHRKVLVSLNEPLAEGATGVWAMVHLDTDGNDTFDFPAADGPASLPGGGFVTVPIRLL